MYLTNDTRRAMRLFFTSQKRLGIPINYGGSGGASFVVAGISKAGIPTSVWATTHECRNSIGSENQLLTEVAIMATIPTKTCPKNLHPVFCKCVCNARPAILAKFARISRHLTLRQRVSPAENKGVPHEQPHQAILPKSHDPLRLY